MSVELQDYIEKTEELEKIYTEQRKTGLHGFFKDIEIRRVEFILLVLIFNCLGCIVSLTMDLTIFRLNAMLLSSFTSHTIGLIVGVLAGVIFAAYKIDREKKRFRLIQLCLFIATLNSILQISFLGPDEVGMIFTIISYGITGFIVVVMFFMLMTLFLEYSSILERGRVLLLLRDRSRRVRPEGRRDNGPPLFLLRRAKGVRPLEAVRPEVARRPAI